MVTLAPQLAHVHTHAQPGALSGAVTLVVAGAPRAFVSLDQAVAEAVRLYQDLGVTRQAMKERRLNLGRFLLALREAVPHGGWYALLHTHGIHEKVAHMAMVLACKVDGSPIAYATYMAAGSANAAEVSLGVRVNRSGRSDLNPTERSGLSGPGGGRRGAAAPATVANEDGNGTDGTDGTYGRMTEAQHEEYRRTHPRDQLTGEPIGWVDDEDDDVALPPLDEMEEDEDLDEEEEGEVSRGGADGAEPEQAAGLKSGADEGPGGGRRGAAAPATAHTLTLANGHDEAHGRNRTDRTDRTNRSHGQSAVAKSTQQLTLDSLYERADAVRIELMSLFEGGRDVVMHAGARMRDLAARLLGLADELDADGVSGGTEGNLSSPAAAR